MSQPRNDGPDVPALLKADMPRLVRALDLKGHRSGNYWMCSSRAHDNKIGTMYVTLQGGMAGAWKDAVADQSGDVIGLIAYIKFGDKRANMRDTFAWAREFLGLGTMTPEQRQRASQEAQRREVAESVRAAQELAENRRAAKAIWIDAKQYPFIDSVADRYLKTRGIDVRHLTRMPGCLGWLPRRYHMDAKSSWPVMVANFTDDSESVVACHFTYLAPDGSGKAPLPPIINERGEETEAPQRKIWPSFKGAAIRLWRGASKRSLADANAWAAKHGELETLVLCEGVEDGLSSVLAYPEYRTWAVGTLGNLGNIRLPKCVGDVIVWRDNDWSKPQAAALFKKGIEALQAQGVTVRVARSAIGKDANDALCSALRMPTSHPRPEGGMA